LVIGVMIVGAVFLYFVTGGLLWLEGYVRDQHVNALQISGQVAQDLGARSGQQVDTAFNDSLLIFGFLAILLAPMAFALAKTGTAGWKVSTFLCCTVAAWFLVFAETSGLLVALVAWLLAWACALAIRISFNRRRA
jgi:hypothetical protein